MKIFNYRKIRSIDYEVPYGFIKDKNNNQLIIDTASIDVVHQIFNMARQGKRAQEIARHLNACCILTPEQYYSKRILGKKNNTILPELWDKHHIRSILRNKIYEQY